MNEDDDLDNLVEFNRGDTVQLASDGPLLTVLDTGKHTGEIFCQWFNRDKEITCGMFSPGCLTLVREAASGENS